MRLLSQLSAPQSRKQAPLRASNRKASGFAGGYLLQGSHIYLIDAAAAYAARDQSESLLHNCLAICSSVVVTFGRHSVRSSPKRVMPLVMVTSGRAEKLKRAWLV